MDRNFLHRGSAVPADLYCRERRYGLACHPDLRESANLVSDAAVRLGAVLSSRGCAAGNHDGRHLSWHHSIRRHAVDRTVAVLPFSPTGALAAEDNRVVIS